MAGSVIAAGNDALFGAVAPARWTGRNGSTIRSFATNAERVKHRERLNRLIAEIVAGDAARILARQA